MTDSIPHWMLDEKTPSEVVVTDKPREPVSDPRLGIEVEKAAEGSPRHRLVTIGDSLTHGFQSGAIYNTDISYPAIIACELGWYHRFRKPSYFRFGGLPLNLEFLIRQHKEEFGYMSVFRNPLGGIWYRNGQRSWPITALRCLVDGSTRGTDDRF